MENRFCIFCDRPVEKIPKPTKEWTTGGAPQGEYKHSGPSCGRQFLFTHETYTETDATP